jgi:hypothetical protein
VKRGTRVRRRSNGATGRVGADVGEGHYHVRFDGGSSGNIDGADLDPIDEPSAGDAPAREIVKSIVGGDIETK